MSLNIKEVYDSINEYVERGEEVSKIRDYLSNKFHYAFDYIEDLFLDEYRLTIVKYTKMKKLQCAYHIWIQNGRPTLTGRAEFGGVTAFIEKFENAFGGTPEEIYDKDIDLDNFLPGGDVFSFLEDSDLIKNFRLKGHEIYVEINKNNVLRKLMSLPTFVIPQKIWKMITDSNNLDHEDKKQLIILLSEACERESLEISLRLEDYADRIEILELYNIEEPYESDGGLVFSPVIADSYRTLFEDEVDSIIDKLSISSLYPTNDAFMRTFATWKAGVLSQSGNTLKSFADYSKVDVQKVKALLWKYIKIGFIRYAA